MQQLRFSNHARLDFIMTVGQRGRSNSDQHEVNIGPYSQPSGIAKCVLVGVVQY